MAMHKMQKSKYYVSQILLPSRPTMHTNWRQSSDCGDMHHVYILLSSMLYKCYYFWSWISFSFSNTANNRTSETKADFSIPFQVSRLATFSQGLAIVISALLQSHMTFSLQLPVYIGSMSFTNISMVVQCFKYTILDWGDHISLVGVYPRL